jgi:membrane protease YdiL (CAAX protease family)
VNEAAGPNSRAALIERRADGRVTWTGPALMLFARSGLAIVAQGIVAVIVASRGSTHPWAEAAVWFPLYAVLIDGGCLGALWLLARHEGIRLRELIGFSRARLGRDMLFGVALIVPSLILILGGIYASSWLVYCNLTAPDILAPLPLLPALYAVLVFPLLWGITEQTTYNGYLAPRFQVLGGTGAALVLVSLVWSFQHAVMPLTFDPHFMLYRALAPIPFSAFQVFLYLRLRRIVPFATAHWLMDGGDSFVRTLWPLLH